MGGQECEREHGGIQLADRGEDRTIKELRQAREQLREAQVRRDHMTAKNRRPISGVIKQLRQMIKELEDERSDILEGGDLFGEKLKNEDRFQEMAASTAGRIRPRESCHEGIENSSSGSGSEEEADSEAVPPSARSSNVPAAQIHGDGGIG